MPLQIQQTTHPDVKLVKPVVHEDHRGSFCETWNAHTFSEAGIDAQFCQDNQSWSRQAGTVRGLHFQAPPFAQAKLVRVLKGAINDVVVDVRRQSPHFGKWICLRLTDTDSTQLFVPRGFLHGFVTLEPDTVVSYKVDSHYDLASSGAVRWDDPELAINWGMGDLTPVLSEKDAAAISWAEFVSPF